MNFMQIVNPDNLGAEFFVDKDFNPVIHEFTIKAVTSEPPPTGGKNKPCVYFEETPKKAFLAVGEIKKIARTLRKTDVEEWKGVKIAITYGQKRLAGKPVAGMVVCRVGGKNV